MYDICIYKKYKSGNKVYKKEDIKRFKKVEVN